MPNNLVLGIVSTEADAGSQQKNPFNFKHCDLESVTLYVNDQSIPFKPLEFNFDEDLYTASYLSLFSLQHDIGCDIGLDIRLSDYDSGYCLIAFDIKAEVDGTEQSARSSERYSLLRHGQCALHRSSQGCEDSRIIKERENKSER